MNIYCQFFDSIKINSYQWIYAFLFLLMAAIPLQAQVVFEASIDRKQVPLNGQVKVSFTIKNGSDVKGFSPPDFNPFKSRGPSTSSSMQIINGDVSKSESYTYVLTPTKKGKFTIRPASAISKGKKINSNALEIEVTDPVDKPNRSNQGNGSSIDEKELAKNLYVRVIPNKRKVYKGEEIILTYKLFSRVRTSNINYTKTPQYNGFLHHELELSKSGQSPKNELIDGEQFQTQVFKRVAVFPTKSGTVTIPSIEFSADVLFQERDPFFRNSFFTRTKRYPFEFKSNAITVEVENLPSGAEGFTGGVGQFNYAVNYDKTQTSANDPITLKIKISGLGNVTMLDIPNIDFPASFELYDPKIKENLRKSGSNISGSKTYEYLIVPRGGGEFKMPDLTLSHFDPVEKSYVSKKFEGPTITVEGERLEEGGISSSGNATGAASSEEIDVLNKDIRYIQDGNIHHQSESTLVNAPWFWVLSSFPLLVLFGLPQVVAGFRLRQKDMASRGALAEKNAWKKLNALKNHHENEWQPILWHYISEKTGVPIASLNKEKANEALAPLIGDQEARTLLQIIEECEQLAYSPQSDLQRSRLQEEIMTLFKNLNKK